MVKYRLINDLLRSRLSRGHTIRLLAHPLSRLQVAFLSQSSCVSPVELTDGKRKGAGEKPIIRLRESLALYNHSLPYLIGYCVLEIDVLRTGLHKNSGKS
jgi:hypothetical protein